MRCSRLLLVSIVLGHSTPAVGQAITRVTDAAPATIVGVWEDSKPTGLEVRKDNAGKVDTVPYPRTLVVRPDSTWTIAYAKVDGEEQKTDGRWSRVGGDSVVAGFDGSPLLIVRLPDGRLGLGRRWNGWAHPKNPDKDMLSYKSSMVVWVKRADAPTP